MTDFREETAPEVSKKQDQTHRHPNLLNSDFISP